MQNRKASSESGNMLIYILIGIVLIGFLTVALRDNGALDGSVDKERAASQATQIIKYGGELAQGVNTLLQNGVSETDIRFAYPGTNATYGDITINPQNQVFSNKGAGVPYRSAPSNSQTTATAWAFQALRALPQVGSSKSDLTGVLRNLTDSTCTAINTQLGITVKPSLICTASAVFSGTYPQVAFMMDESAFSVKPAEQFCAYCSDTSANNYFVTLIAR